MHIVLSNYLCLFLSIALDYPWGQPCKESYPIFTLVQFKRKMPASATLNVLTYSYRVQNVCLNMSLKA